MTASTHSIFQTCPVRIPRRFVPFFSDHDGRFQHRSLTNAITVTIAILMLVATGSTLPAQTNFDAPIDEAKANGAAPQSDRNSPESEFDAQRSFDHLLKICEIGPRISTTAGMAKQQAYLTQHFQPLGAEIKTQKFLVTNPLARSAPRGFQQGVAPQLELANLIVRFRPELKQRLLFCCHYDTRPFPDRDRRNPQGTFIGANDGASGVAVLSELARHLPEMKGTYGIDLVFFDGEEFVYVDRRDPMFLGSTHFANAYLQRKEDFRYAYAVLVDMVGDKNLQIYFESNSLAYAPRLTKSIWGVAQRLNIREFVPKEKYKISDDHLPLNSIARIPTCDIIDFDFPTPQSKNAFWHTEKDVPENCSAESLAKVGRVLLQWTREMQQLNVAPAQR